MSRSRVHTTRKISFESADGELDLSLEARGFSLRVFRSDDGGGGPVALVLAEDLPLSMAVEIRDFLIYALKGYDEGDMK